MAIALIFDCGATNLRTIAINEKGQILASHHLANNTKQGIESSDYHIWDIEEYLAKINLLCNSNPQSINATRY